MMPTAADNPRPRTGRYACELAGPGDSAAIRALLRQPMPGRVRFAMTHGPDHRASVGLASERVDEVVVRDTHRPGGEVVGCGYRAVRRVLVNGRPVSVGYLGGLRCEAALRAAFRVLASAFDTLAQARRPGELPWDFTSVMADNTVVRRGLEKGLAGLPVYTPVGELATLTIRTKRHGALSRGVRGAEPGDAGLIQRRLDDTAQRYHGRHAWRVAEAWAQRDGGDALPGPEDFLVFEPGAGHAPACLALWDTRALRQIVLAGLSPALRRGRVAINLAAWITGRPSLPPTGSQLGMAYASHAGFSLDDGRAAHALLAGVCALAAQRGIPLVSIGLPIDAPILPGLVRRLKPWVSRSVIYAVAHDPACVRLDGRPVWMEVATL